MQISTTARHCELDPEDRLFAQQRLEKLSRYVRDAREAHLTVTAEKYRHTAEILLKLKHREIVSREQSTEPRMAIGLAADRLEEQLRRGPADAGVEGAPAGGDDELGIDED